MSVKAQGHLWGHDNLRDLSCSDSTVETVTVEKALLVAASSSAKIRAEFKSTFGLIVKVLEEGVEAVCGDSKEDTGSGSKEDP